MTGCEAQIGITYSSLLTKVTASLHSEDDLIAGVICSSSNTPVK